MTVISLLRTDDIEQLPIPEYMIDYSSGTEEAHSITYKAVPCNREEYFGSDYKTQKGSCADLLCDEGKQWLALYATTDKTTGAPITADIIVQKSKDAPQDYENAITIIGELGAVNLASSAFRNYSALSQTWQSITSDYSVYVFYKTDNTVLPAGEPQEGETTATAMSGGMIALIGIGGLLIGGALGAVIAVMINKNKKKPETV